MPRRTRHVIPTVVGQGGFLPKSPGKHAPRGRASPASHLGGFGHTLALPVCRALVLVCVSGTASLGATRHVEPGQPGAVGATLEQAAAGDSIVLAAGVYRENLVIDKDIVLVGAGAEATRVEPMEAGSVIQGTSHTWIARLTLANGKGEDRGLEHHGGAILWEHGALEVHNCRFEGNDLGSSVFTRGGAIAGSYVDRLVVADCEFTRSTAGGFGGHIWGFGQDVNVIRCRFEVDEDDAPRGSGAAMAIVASTIVVEDCYVLGRSSTTLTGTRACGDDVTFRGNTFIDEGPARSASNVGLFPQCVDLDSDQNLLFEGNVVAFKPPKPAFPPEVSLGAWNGEMMARNNTIVNCNLILGGANSVLTFETSIVTKGTVLFGIPGNSRCNCYFECTVRGVGIKSEGDIEADPVFCGPDEWTIDASSPCAAENVPEGCGQIGALPIECFNPVTRLSWGKLKNTWRE